MKAFFSGLAVSFSLYSFLPVPQVKWEKNTMKFAMGFLPFIGLIIGLLEAGWLWCGRLWQLNPFFYAVIAVLLPIIVSGGIHLDGFIDTCDALCSYGDRERRLEIMKDSHVGAFGVLYLIGLLLLQTALYTQLFELEAAIPVLAVGYVASRAAGGGLIVFVRCARNSGLAHLFSENSEKTPVRAAMAVWLLICSAAAFWCSVPLGAAAVVSVAAFYAFHTYKCIKNFGGITGDLAGFFITLTETLILAVCVIGGLAIRG